MSTHDHSTGRTRLLTPAEIDALPLCEGCSAPELRRSWAVAAQEQYGWGGVRIGQESATLGAALISPPERDENSLRVRLVWVHPQWRDQGVGRQLLQAVAAQARRSAIDEVIGTGTRLVPTCQTPPLSWWLHHGFMVSAEDPVHPQVTLDLSRTATWSWWSSLVDRIRRSVIQWDAPPHPTGRSTRSTVPVRPTGQGNLTHPPTHPREAPVLH